MYGQSSLIGGSARRPPSGVLAQDRRLRARPARGRDRCRAARPASGGPAGTFAGRRPDVRSGTGPGRESPSAAPATARRRRGPRPRRRPRRCSPHARRASSRSSSSVRRSSSSRRSRRAGRPDPQLDSGGRATEPAPERTSTPPAPARRSPPASGPGDEPLEARQCRVRPDQREPIARRRRLDRAGAERPAQADHARLHLLRPRRRRTSAQTASASSSGAATDPAATPARTGPHARADSASNVPSTSTGPSTATLMSPIINVPQRSRQPGPYRTHTGEHAGPYRIRHTPDCRSA